MAFENEDAARDRIYGYSSEDTSPVEDAPAKEKAPEKLYEIVSDDELNAAFKALGEQNRDVEAMKAMAFGEPLKIEEFKKMFRKEVGNMLESAGMDDYMESPAAEPINVVLEKLAK